MIDLPPPELLGYDLGLAVYSVKLAQVNSFYPTKKLQRSLFPIMPRI